MSKSENTSEKKPSDFDEKYLHIHKHYYYSSKYKKKDNTMSKEASDAVAWGAVIAFVTGVAMAVKAAFTDAKKEDKQ